MEEDNGKGCDVQVFFYYVHLGTTVVVLSELCGKPDCGAFGFV